MKYGFFSLELRIKLSLWFGRQVLYHCAKPSTLQHGFSGYVLLKNTEWILDSASLERRQLFSVGRKRLLDSLFLVCGHTTGPVLKAV